MKYKDMGPACQELFRIRLAQLVLPDGVVNGLEEVVAFFNGSDPHKEQKILQAEGYVEQALALVRTSASFDAKEYPTDESIALKIVGKYRERLVEQRKHTVNQLREKGAFDAKM